MKKLQYMTTALSGAIITAGVLFSSSAEACPFSGKYKNFQSGNSLISLNSWLSKTLPSKSHLTIAGIAAGTVGLMGLGGFYASRRLTRKVETNVDATNDSMEILVEEAFVQQHPEAPGGYLDLVENKDIAEKETVVLK